MNLEHSEDLIVPPAVLTDLQEAAEKAAKGLRDPKEMQKACEEMDRIREENRRKFGTQDIGVSIIRELRGGE